MSSLAAVRPARGPAEDCPDCGGELYVDGSGHSETCPIVQAMVREIIDDRMWFAIHRGATRRRRPVTPSIRARLVMFGYDPPSDAFILVRIDDKRDPHQLLVRNNA